MSIKEKVDHATNRMALWILIFLSIFYLFVIPSLVAPRAEHASRWGIGLALFFYLQFWMLTIELAYSSAAKLYRRERQHLFPFMQNSQVWKALTGVSSIGVGVPCLASYLVTVFGFAIAYSFLSSINKAAFTCPHLGLFDAFYFSFVTAATVGYGDISPVSTAARLFVMLEILFSLVYAVFVFSVVASAVKDGSSNAS